MKKIIDWLATRFSGDSTPIEAVERHHPAPPPEPVQGKDDDQETVNQPGLGLQDDADPEPSRDKGFDPYNTGSLDVSKVKESSSDE